MKKRILGILITLVMLIGLVTVMSISASAAIYIEERVNPNVLSAGDIISETYITPDYGNSLTVYKATSVNDTTPDGEVIANLFTYRDQKYLQEPYYVTYVSDTVLVLYPLKTCTITFNPNGGVGETKTINGYQEVPLSKQAVSFEAYTRTYYTLTGWNTAANGTGTTVTEDFVPTSSNNTVYAQWTPNTYTVTLNTNGGTIGSGKVTSYTYGTGATLPTDMTKDGYIFEGWYDNESFSGAVVTVIGTSETGDKTYYAKWAIRYDLVIDGVQVTDTNKDDVLGNGKVSYDPETNTLTLNNATIGSIASASAIIAYTDINVKLVGVNTIESGIAFDIDGALSIGGSGSINIVSSNLGIYATGNITITGGTINAAASDGVIYTEDGNVTISGGTVRATATGAYGMGIVAGSVIWNGGTLEVIATDEDGYGIGTKFGVTVNGTVIVYAGEDATTAVRVNAPDSSTYSSKYVKIAPASKVTVNYGVNGVDNVSIMLERGEKASLATPVVEGYIFIGWYADADFTTAFDFTNPITEDVMVYAKFADYEGDKKTLQDAIDALETAVDTVETALNHKVSTDKLTEEIGKLNQAIAGAKTYADTQDAALKTTLEAADATMNAAIAELQNRVTALETGLNTANGKINTNASDVATLKTDVSTLKTWQTEAQNAIESLKTLTATQGTNISALQTAVADLENALTKANDKITAAEVRIAALEGKVSALETAKQELEDAVSALQTAVATKADAATVNAAIAELQAAIDALEAVKNNYIGADATLKTELEGKIETAKSEAITAANTALTTAKNELSQAIALKADTATLNAKVDALNTAVNNAESVAKAYADTQDAALKAELQTAIANAKSDLEALIGGVQSDLDTTKAKLDKAIKDLNKAIADGDTALDTKITNLNTALNNAVAALEQADTDNKAELVKKIEDAEASLQAAIDKVASDLTKAQKDLADAIATGDASLSRRISSVNTSLSAAKTALEKADADNKAALEAKIEAAEATLDAAIKAVQKNLDDAKAELNKAIADGDTALDDKISALNEALATAKAALVATDRANKSALITKINEADATLTAAIDALSNELNATNEKVAELETFIIIVCVISGVAFCGCGTLAVFYILDKKKKI